MKTKKTYSFAQKLGIGLIILALLSPVGIWLPHFFNAGDAWGEWDVETVTKQTGQTPEGMKKDAELWNAPVPDYNPGKEDDSLAKRSGYYILSGFIGLGAIALLTFGVYRFLLKK